jgi:CheY-specific phosphatase CheX
MTHLKRDLLIGIMLVIGIAGFISGEFVVSTVWFASAAIFSNLYLSRKLHG